MTDLTIGIIGTAGRQEDAGRLNHQTFQLMKAAVLGVIAPYLPESVTLISGGAAVADHIATQLFLGQNHCRLRLHLPAKFDTVIQRFFDKPGRKNDPGTIANYYHDRFQETCHVPSLQELSTAMFMGAETIVTPGFKERNTRIAQDAQILIALTFGEGGLLKAGGTADTMAKFLQKKEATSFHIDCHTMRVYTPARVVPAPAAKPTKPSWWLETPLQLKPSWVPDQQPRPPFRNRRCDITQPAAQCA